jgi:rhodanese-related sulfurtransferase
MLGRHDVILVDVRDPISWDKSDSKIRGAVRENPEQLTAWANKYPKDKTLIFYCS